MTIDVDKVLAIAMQAVGPVSPAEWADRVTEMAVEVAVAFGEQSPQRAAVARILEAQVFTGDFLGYHVEESSTRCVVKLGTGVTTKRPDGIETIRTDRTDTPAGRRMKARLDAIPTHARVVVWKAMETANQETKVRVLAHIAVLGLAHGAEKSAGGPEAVTPPSRTRGASGATSPPADQTATVNAEAKQMLDGLTGPQRLEVLKRARAAGIDNVMSPGGRLDELLSIILDVQGSPRFQPSTDEEPF